MSGQLLDRNQAESIIRQCEGPHPGASGPCNCCQRVLRKLDAAVVDGYVNRTSFRVAVKERDAAEAQRDELLAACREALHEMDDENPEGPYSPGHMELRAAIAKATGEGGSA